MKGEQKYELKFLQVNLKETHRATVLQCNINIKERFTPINEEAIRKAMFSNNKYPKDRGIKIEDMDFDI